MNKKLLIAILTLVLIVTGAFLWQSRAEKNNKQIKALKSSAVEAVFSDDVILGRTETDEEVDRILQKCKNLEKLSSQLEENRNGDKAVTAVKILNNACKGYTASVQLAQAEDANEEKKKLLLTDPATGLCEDDAPCLNVINFAKYKDLFQNTISTTNAYVGLLEKNCSYPEMQKICNVELAYFRKEAELNANYNIALDTDDVSEASKAYDSNVFPDKQICAEASRITSRTESMENCHTEAFIALTKKYEKILKTELDRI